MGYMKCGSCELPANTSMDCLMLKNGGAKKLLFKEINFGIVRDPFSNIF
jgi:hypothetical protein